MLQGGRCAATTLATARSPRGEVILRRHGDGVLELRVNGVFVMDTARTSTERALAREALTRAAAPGRVLVGGLGLGFTVAELLADARVQQVIVAELEPSVAGWMSDGTIPHGPAIVTDPRVDIRVGDVRDVVISQPRGSLGAILLDVDNGPDFLVFETNAEVYTSGFLHRCVERLRPGGLLAVWSSTRSVSLEHTLCDVAGSCDLRPMPVDLAGRAEEYVLYLATA